MRPGGIKHHRFRAILIVRGHERVSIAGLPDQQSVTAGRSEAGAIGGPFMQCQSTLVAAALVMVENFSQKA